MSFCQQICLQWNLSKADAIGTNKIERVSSGQGFIIHYVGYIWDSVSVHYREGVLWRGVSAKRGSTVYPFSLLGLFFNQMVGVFRLLLARHVLVFPIYLFPGII